MVVVINIIIVVVVSYIFDPNTASKFSFEFI